MAGSPIKTIRCGLILLGCHLSAYAVNPVPGGYAGIFLGPTYAQNIDFTLNQIIPLPTDSRIPGNTTGSLKYSVLGGVGGEIGYRFCTKYRVEIEAFYNNNPFKKLQIGNYTIDSVASSVNFHIGGDTNMGAGLINVFYDLLPPSRDNYGAVFPYIGLGAGYAYVQNALQFHYNTPAYLSANPAPTSTNFETDFKRTYTIYAGQIVMGIGYFLDDFTWLSADIRYFSTGKKTVNTYSSYTTNTASFTQQTKLLSIMVSFNGAIDLG